MAVQAGAQLRPGVAGELEQLERVRQLDQRPLQLVVLRPPQLCKPVHPLHLEQRKLLVHPP